MASRLVIPVDQGWTFRQADQDDSPWRPVAQFPTNVHLDLLAYGLIPDPNMGTNELDVQWVGERAWAYRTTFATPARRPGTKTVLAFDGLDTFATVVLNGTTILESDNMFVPYRVDVGAALAAAPGSDNELVITFDSAYLRGWQLVEEHPGHKYGCWNGDNSRLTVRKAQYHWGWDWGPTLLTCGPWRPIHLEVYDARISDLSFATVVDESLQKATVEARAEIETTSAAAATAAAVRFDVSLAGVAVASETVAVDAAAGRASVVFRIPSPALWYPWRYGKQPLYTVCATLLQGPDGGAVADMASKRIGLRRAELVQEALADQPGTSFYFRINNVPVFCGGSNWIPADSFIPRIDAQRYRAWMQRVVDGNQIMLRVWGGGIYEEQALYDACDELGVLVWQDFLFACGNYPVWPALRASIRREAEANVRRLRHHPSIVLWAGNNEDYQYRESEHLTYDYANKDAASWLQTDFPARYIYEKILADVCAALVPDTYYHYGSPWGAGKDTHDPTVGDIHQWNVWHGTQERYQDFGRLGGRFVSEFGMEALPSTQTIDGFLPDGRHDAERYAQSATLDHHNKAAGQARRLALYLAENIRWGPEPLAQYVYATQLIQAESVATAYRVWLRQWRGAAAGRAYCGGALVWQINDCWPGTSWSLVDYHGRAKHAYHAVRRALAPLTVGVARSEAVQPARRPPHSRLVETRRTRLAVWATNLAATDRVGVACVVHAWDVETGRPAETAAAARVVVRGCTLAANQSTELAVLDLEEGKDGLGDPARTVVAVYLVADEAADATATALHSSTAGTILARSVNWPEPLKYLHLARPKQLTAELDAAGTTVALQAEVPVKGVVVEVDEDADADADAVQFADNLVDLVPGEVVRIGVRGASAATKLRTRYLGMDA